MSNTFGNCANGKAAPTSVAISAASVRLRRRLFRIWVAIQFKTSISTLAARAGAQLSIDVSGASAIVRDGTGKPETEAA